MSFYIQYPRNMAKRTWLHHQLCRNQGFHLIASNLKSLRQKFSKFSVQTLQQKSANFFHKGSDSSRYFRLCVLRIFSVCECVIFHTSSAPPTPFSAQRKLPDPEIVNMLGENCQRKILLPFEFIKCFVGVTLDHTTTFLTLMAGNQIICYW